MVDPQVEAALSVLAMFEDLEAYWYDEGRDCRSQYDGQGAEFL